MRRRISLSRRAAASRSKSTAFVKARRACCSIEGSQAAAPRCKEASIPGSVYVADRDLAHHAFVPDSDIGAITIPLGWSLSQNCLIHIGHCADSGEDEASRPNREEHIASPVSL